MAIEYLNTCRTLLLVDQLILIPYERPPSSSESMKNLKKLRGRINLSLSLPGKGKK